MSPFYRVVHIVFGIERELQEPIPYYCKVNESVRKGEGREEGRKSN